MKPSGDRLEAGLSAAARYLLAAQEPDGRWVDMDMEPTGPSDEYITAYIAVRLAGVNDPQAREAVRKAWELLLSRRGPADGWGWSSRLPTDADSTAWGLRLAQAVGAAGVARAEAARRVLALHQLPSGGVACYREGVFLRRPFDGWTQAHACVTAGAAGVAEFRDSTLAYLKQAQRPDGSWKSYWWSQPELGTALAAEALAMGGTPFRQSVERAGQWAKGRLNARGAAASPERPGGSPFATAACLHAMLMAGETMGPQSAAGLALAWLLGSQRADGSWSPSARIRVPPHEAADPDENPAANMSALDMKRTFTAATVLAALTVARDRAG